MTLKTIIENRTEAYIARFITTPLNNSHMHDSLVISELVITDSGPICVNVFESSAQLMASINERRDTWFEYLFIRMAKCYILIMKHRNAQPLCLIWSGRFPFAQTSILCWRIWDRGLYNWALFCLVLFLSRTETSTWI